MIHVYFNGEACVLASTQSLHELLLQKKYVDLNFAVAINNQFIPRTAYHTTTVNQQDRIDILVPMQGG